MKRIHAELEDKDFEKPEDITQETVCSKSGLLPEEGVCESDPRGSLNYKEYFSEESKPTDTCDRHISLAICTESGAVAGEYCPEELIETHTYIVGAENGSGDASYSVTEDFINTVCDIHDENYQPEEPDEENPDGDVESDDPDNPDETGGTDEPENPDEESPDRAEAGLTAFGLWDWLLRLQRRM
jgi:penicillin-binding protein 1A